MNKNNDPLTVSELCQLIQNIIPKKKFIISGEINQLKNSHGHIFFTFKDNENSINVTIWKYRNEIIKPKIKEGDKITIEGKLDFYSVGGKLNFIVDQILTNDGIGEMLVKYELIKTNFQKKGYFDNSNKNKVGKIIKNIVLLTSETGAAYHDFLYGLENANAKINVELIDVIVQGNDCPKNICEELDRIKKEKSNYDLVILTRGGGSFQDLFGFSNPLLIETLYKFNLPTLSAIGHQIDNPLSDLVCDYTAPTPSLGAQFIVDHNKAYINNLKNILKDMANQMVKKIIHEQDKLNKMLEELNKKILIFETLNKKKLLNEINEEKYKLEQLEIKLYSYQTSNIILNGNGNIFKSSDDLKNYKGKTLEIVWDNVVVKVNVL